MEQFDERIRRRVSADNYAFENSFDQMAGVVMGERFVHAMAADQVRSQNAISQVMGYYHLDVGQVPSHITDINEQMDYLMGPVGMMRRAVHLTDGWYKDAVGAFIAIRKDDQAPVALLPSAFGGYRYRDGSGKYVKVNKRTAGAFELEAMCFYRPLPQKSLTIRDLLRFALTTVSLADLAFLVLATVLVTAAGMLIPPLNQLIYSYVVKMGTPELVGAVFFSFTCISLYQVLMGGLRDVFSRNVSVKMGAAVEAAAMMRMLSLPSTFFKRYGAGELTSRNQQVSGFVRSLVDVIFSTGLTSVFSLAFVGQMFMYGEAMGWVGLAIVVATVVLALLRTLVSVKLNKRIMEASARVRSLTLELFSGIQKIKLAGAEKRAFARWAQQYSESAKLSFDPPLIVKFYSPLATVVSLVGTLLVYIAAYSTGVQMGDYYAFNAAYVAVLGAFMSLTQAAGVIANLKPTYEFIRPLLDCVPEIDQTKDRVTSLDGRIELTHVTFRYQEGGRAIVNDLSLEIKPGEYVAIVGPTGCGKSTLVRLLLGMEKPESGSVAFDGLDLCSLDLKSVRRRIGTVLQDGQLFTGDIYSNIVVTNPRLTLEDAWEAARLAGLADDLECMPMNMHTLISEGGGGVSGGQKQRILIARAVAPKPNILIFDEATSALDNITQKMVSDALDGLNCTRVVIAHRLSTIRNADRILYLDGGKILEQGTYEELMQREGLFAKLVERQRL